jgi:hypothetical protein
MQLSRLVLPVRTCCHLSDMQRMAGNTFQYTPCALDMPGDPVASYCPSMGSLFFWGGEAERACSLPLPLLLLDSQCLFQCIQPTGLHADRLRLQERAIGMQTNSSCLALLQPRAALRR